MLEELLDLDLPLGHAIKAEWRAAGALGRSFRGSPSSRPASSSGVEQGPFSRRWLLRRSEPSGWAVPGQARCF